MHTECLSIGRDFVFSTGASPLESWMTWSEAGEIDGDVDWLKSSWGKIWCWTWSGLRCRYLGGVPEHRRQPWSAATTRAGPRGYLCASTESVMKTKLKCYINMRVHNMDKYSLRHKNNFQNYMIAISQIFNQVIKEPFSAVHVLKIYPC